MAVRLGKGLGALLGEDSVSALKTQENYKMVDIKKIKPNPKQARKKFDEKEINELCESIKIHGIIQPVLLNGNEDDGYVIIAGERRFRAAKKAGIKEIPAIVKDYKEQQLMEVSLIENLQRVDLNPIEEAMGIKDLIDKCGLTQEEAADKLGKNRSSIANTLRLLSLPYEVVEMIQNDKISKGHAKCLIGINDKEMQLFLANKIAMEGLSVRELEKLIKEQKKPVIKSKNKLEIPELKDFEMKLSELFCTKVKVTGNEKKGSIKIDYYSLEELNQIYDIILNK